MLVWVVNVVIAQQMTDMQMTGVVSFENINSGKSM